MLFLEVPGEKRIFFVLPYKDQTLIGTTEVRQKISDEVKPAQSEILNLLSAYNHYFIDSIVEKDIVKAFSGVRPLVKSSNNTNKTTREYTIQTSKNLISVFGGKWTTARALAKKVVKHI